jgi:hypothetical protein
MLRYKNTWYAVPDRQDIPAVWMVLKDDTKTSNSAMVEWHAKQRKIAALLYPVINNECAATASHK